MQTPPEITVVDFEKPDWLEDRVRARIGRLERISDRLIGCKVWIRAPHRRHRTGTRYQVDIEVATPERVLAVDRDPGDAAAHEDLTVAIRDAFDAIERQLRRWKQQHGGRPAVHAAPLQGKVAELDAEGGFGQIAAADGRLVYFHANSVAGDISALSVGTPVELSVDEGDAEDGHHASMVRPISRARFHGERE